MIDGCCDSLSWVESDDAGWVGRSIYTPSILSVESDDGTWVVLMID
jgi:hypothetical protein